MKLRILLLPCIFVAASYGGCMASAETAEQKMALSSSRDMSKEYYYAEGKRVYVDYTSGDYHNPYEAKANESDKPARIVYDVKLNDGVDEATFTEALKDYNITIKRFENIMSLWAVVSVDPAEYTSLSDLPELLKRFNLSATVEPRIHNVKLDNVSYDPYVGQCWAIYNPDGYDMNISSAWNYATGKGVTIAVVDNGVDPAHPELEGRVLNGMDLVTGSPIPEVYYQTDSKGMKYNHGNGCAGCAAAARNNNLGIAGVAPDAMLMSFSHDIKSHTGYSLTDGIKFAADMGADVISCSWTTTYGSKFQSICRYALAKGRNGKGSIIVFSAGNRVTESDSIMDEFKSVLKDVIYVGSLNSNGVLASHSQYGEALFITAPGESIKVLYGSSEYSTSSGTSYAAPFVSGIVALMLERNPELTYREVLSILARTARKEGGYPYDQEREFGSWNKYYGYGLVDAHAAILASPKYWKE